MRLHNGRTRRMRIDSQDRKRIDGQQLGNGVGLFRSGALGAARIRCPSNPTFGISPPRISQPQQFPLRSVPTIVESCRQCGLEATYAAAHRPQTPRRISNRPRRAPLSQNPWNRARLRALEQYPANSHPPKPPVLWPDKTRAQLLARVAPVSFSHGPAAVDARTPGFWGWRALATYPAACRWLRAPAFRPRVPGTGERKPHSIQRYILWRYFY